MTDATASVAVIGGSGLYSLFDAGESERHSIATPYGNAEVTIGELGGRRTVFLARHGVGHAVAPHLINYRANIWALASLGVTAILSSAAVGGVSPDHPPGTLVLTDQFIDRTSGRADTFFDGSGVGQPPPQRRTVLPGAARDCPLRRSTVSRNPSKKSGTVVVIQGPRFSTDAEVAWFRAAGAHTINMTLYPEVSLASELNIGTVNLSYVTDGDADPATKTKS